MWALQSSPVIGAVLPTEYGLQHEYVLITENIEVTQIIPGRTGLEFGVRYLAWRLISRKTAL
jgi:hypothetical protein